MKLFSRQDNTTEANFGALAVDMSIPADASHMRDITSTSVSLNAKAWENYKIGEINYAVSRSARTAGYAELGIYMRNKDGTPGRKSTNTDDQKMAKMFRSPIGGYRGFIERFVTLMKVPGDSWLIRCVDYTGPNDAVGVHRGYDFVGAAEWEQASLDSLGDKSSTKDLMRNMRPGGSGAGGRQEAVRRKDVLGRVWRPSAQWVDLPHSPMAALEDTCEVLVKLTKGILHRLDQRIMMNGIWYFPNSINKTISAAPSGQPNQYSNTETINEVMKQMKHSQLAPDDPMSAIPVLVSGPGDDAHNVVFHQPDLQIFEVEMKLRTEAIDRILFGLDINPEGVKGTTESNHWGAWAAADDEQRINVKPDLETMCWALEVLIMNAEFLAAGKTAKYINDRMVWYDNSRAQTKTNAAEDTRLAFDRGVAGPKELRRQSGIEEDQAPSGPEYVRMVGWSTGVPQLALWGTPEYDQIDWDKITPTKTGPKADSTAPESRVGPGKGQPGSPNPSDRKNNGPRSARPA